MRTPDVPDEVLRAPSLLRDGNTRIHQHAQRDEIVQVLAMHALAPNAPGKMSVAELSRALNQEYPGLNLPDDEGRYLRTFMARYIVELVATVPEYVRAGLVQAGHNLNMTERKLRMFDRLEGKLERDLDGMKPGDAATAVKAYIEAAGKVEESLERVGAVAPKKPTETHHTEVKVDMAGVLDRLEGRKKKSSDVLLRP